MSARKHKSNVPEAVLDYCIDEKLTVAEGLVAYLEDHFAIVDSALRDLKREVTGVMYAAQAGPDLEKIEKQDMDDIESFLRYLDQQMTDDQEDK